MYELGRRVSTAVVMALVVSLAAIGATSAQDDGGTIEPFIQSDFKVFTGDVQRPNGLYWYEGFLYTSCAGDWTIYRLDGETGSTITYIFGVKNTHNLYVEEDDLGIVVWAADFQQNQFVRISHETGLVVVRDGLAQPWGLTPSATDDTFYMTEWQSDNLLNITRDGEITVVAPNFDDPSGVVATADSIYVANAGSARRAVEWVDIRQDADPTPQPLITGLQQVSNLVMGPDGLLYMAYALGNRGVVGRVDPQVCKDAGGCTNVDVELVVWTELPAPLAGLVVTPEMRLYVHTMFGAEIYWLDLPKDETSQSETVVTG